MTDKAPLPEILIIDDNDVDREGIRRYLNPPGTRPAFAVTEADCGKDGIDLVLSRRFDCVFVDYRLHDMDGVQFLRDIYDPRSGLSPAPVVMLTGEGNETVMLEALRFGAQDYLIKGNLSADAVNIALKKACELFELKAGQRRAEEQLHHMQRMEAVGQLTAGIAHDFNNLLTVVLGNLYQLQQRISSNPDKIDPQYVLKKVETMESVARSGADLVRRLMVFTRQRSLEQEVVDLNECIADTLELLRRPLGETVEIEVRAAQESLPVAIDAVEFGNALINMAINARDAMPRGGKLTISTQKLTVDDPYATGLAGVAAGSYAVVAVTDTGTGMAPDVAARIFEPFFTTKGPGEGTGLGLAMAYGFVKQSRGYITVDSSPGRGTTFRIYLPVAPSEATAAAQGN